MKMNHDIKSKILHLKLPSQMSEERKTTGENVVSIGNFMGSTNKKPF